MEETLVLTEVPVPEEAQPALTQKQIVAAATNDPELAEDEFELGGRVFKIVDLGYDDYIEFVAYLQPLLEGVMGSFAGKIGLDLPGIEIEKVTTIGSLLKFCQKDLPNMSCIVCRATDKEITPEWVKANAKTPFKLVGIVMKQVMRNRIISDFMDFFALVLPTMKGMGLAVEK